MRDRQHFLFLLIIPFIVLLWPPFYNHMDPKLFDIPFFYWFQLLWIILTAIITTIVYFVGAYAGVVVSTTTLFSDHFFFFLHLT